MSILTKDEGLGNSGTGASGGLTVDKDEGRAEMEQATMRFIDLARQMEAFFLQKRFLLSALKPELLVKEEINELKLELVRKEELIKKHNDKIAVWQNMLTDLQGWAQSPAQGPAPSGNMKLHWYLVIEHNSKTICVPNNKIISSSLTLFLNCEIQVALSHLCMSKISFLIF